MGWLIGFVFIAVWTWAIFELLQKKEKFEWEARDLRYQVPYLQEYNNELKAEVRKWKEAYLDLESEFSKYDSIRPEVAIRGLLRHVHQLREIVMLECNYRERLKGMAAVLEWVLGDHDSAFRLAFKEHELASIRHDLKFELKDSGVRAWSKALPE